MEAIIWTGYGKNGYIIHWKKWPVNATKICFLNWLIVAELHRCFEERLRDKFNNNVFVKYWENIPTTLSAHLTPLHPSVGTPAIPLVKMFIIQNSNTRCRLVLMELSAYTFLIFFCLVIPFLTASPPENIQESDHNFFDKSIYLRLAFESHCFHGQI